MLPANDIDGRSSTVTLKRTAKAAASPEVRPALIVEGVTVVETNVRPSLVLLHATTGFGAGVPNPAASK